MLRLGVIGDVHGFWSEADTAWFDASDLHALLFVGDLPGSRTHADVHDVARSLSKLRKPALLIPGNHDGPGPLAVLSEAAGVFRNTRRQVRALGREVEQLERSLGAVVMGGYSKHTFVGDDGVAVDVVCGRPHAMDSRHLTFAGHLGRRHGVHDLASSVHAMYACVRACTYPILFLAHNGPHGLGADASSPWGSVPDRARQRRPGPARRRAPRPRGRAPVLGVVAGHMHRGRGRRPWLTERDGLVYINAARVPRIFWTEAGSVRHHIRLEIEATGIRATEVLVED